MANTVAPADVTPIMKRIESHIASLGYFPRTQIGEPKAMAVNSVMTAALFFKGFAIKALSLMGTESVLEMWLRIYVPMLQEPQEQIEFMLANGYTAVVMSLGSDVTLGGLVRNVDFGGYDGSPMDAKAGYVDVSGVMCRVADISIDAVIDQFRVFGYQNS